ncbi:MAG: zf-HC2 domain-containing protein [Acidobacteriota bacterium]
MNIASRNSADADRQLEAAVRGLGRILPPVSSGHPSLAEWDALLRDALDPDRCREMRQHLMQCEACMDRVGELMTLKAPEDFAYDPPELQRRQRVVARAAALLLTLGFVLLLHFGVEPRPATSPIVDLEPHIVMRGPSVQGLVEVPVAYGRVTLRLALEQEMVAPYEVRLIELGSAPRRGGRLLEDTVETPEGLLVSIPGLWLKGGLRYRLEVQAANRQLAVPFEFLAQAATG